MPTEQLESLEERVEVEVEERVDRIEEVLPTLSTKEDLKATEERLRTELADTEERLRTRTSMSWPRACATWSASLPKGSRRS